MKWDFDFPDFLQDFKVKPGSHDGVSNLSDILGVFVEYDVIGDKAEASKLEIIIKLLPHDPFSRFFVTEAQFDLREIQFYTKVLPDLLNFQESILGGSPDDSPLLVSVPKCLHSHYVSGKYRVSDGHEHQHEEDLVGTPEPPESILVLQDMRPFGYKSAHFIKGLTLQEAEAAIKALSNVHALSLSMKNKENVNLSERYSFLFQTSKATESYQQLVEQGLPQLSKFLESKSGFEKIIDILTGFRSKTRFLIEGLLQPEEPMGLITHTDFWCNNLLFHEDKLNIQAEDSCIILDWQMICYSRPTNDIALLIVSSLSSNIRRNHTQKLLDLYYDSMKKNCLKLTLDIEADLRYSRDQLQEDYR